MRIIIIIVICVIIAIFVFQYMFCTRRRPTCILLLTACVAPPKSSPNDHNTRIEWYTDALQSYLTNTNLDVCIVESSGYHFPLNHPRLKQHTFIQDAGITSSTKAEAYSILQAFDSGMLDGYDIVIKLTGKYILPQLEDTLRMIPKTASIIYQHTKNDDIYWQHSEIFGCKKEFVKSIYEKIWKGTQFMEEAIYDVHKRLGVSAFTLPPLQVAKHVPRADGTIMQQL